MSTSELACTYAALILHDDGLDITVRVSAAGSVRLNRLYNHLAYRMCRLITSTPL
jgi:hypothetical protein